MVVRLADPAVVDAVVVWVVRAVMWFLVLLGIWCALDKLLKRGQKVPMLVGFPMSEESFMECKEAWEKAHRAGYRVDVQVIRQKGAGDGTQNACIASEEQG